MSKKKIIKKTASYHHGDLRAAILGSAEEIIKRDGLHALSLRACAKETGVSHAAPAHHFPSLSSLLSALAAIGFEKLSDAIQNALTKENFKPIDAAKAYVLFALENKELFYLMNDPSRLDSTDSALHKARQKSYKALGAANSASLENPTLEQIGLVTGGWALAHGLAMLMLSGRLKGLLRMAPEDTTEMDLLDAAINSMRRPT
jgi:AcrR family transcriptional regulator